MTENSQLDDLVKEAEENRETLSTAQRRQRQVKDQLREHVDTLAVQDNGIRVPHCPSCDQPVMVEYGLTTGDFAQCPWEDCRVWLAHDVAVTTTAFETRQEAKEAYER